MEDRVNYPAHYTIGPDARPVECIDITRHLPFDPGNAFKYIWRVGKKGDKAAALEDIAKAEWYVTDWAELTGDDAFSDAPGFKTARAVFALLECPRSACKMEALRFEALRLIVNDATRWDIVNALAELRGVLEK